MMQQPWMGSDFTNDDLVRESSFSEDYDYELVGPSEDPEGWKIRFTAKPDLVGLWNRFDLWVDARGALPIKAEYYDRKDRLARVLEWSDVKVFDGRKLPSRMTLIPQDPEKEGEKTELVYHEIEFGVDLPPDMFSLSRLERGE
jgi:outer membrane lipoprotein-sorting protein